MPSATGRFPSNCAYPFKRKMKEIEVASRYTIPRMMVFSGCSFDFFIFSDASSWITRIVFLISIGDSNQKNGFWVSKLK